MPNNNNRRSHGDDWRRRSGTARSDGLTCGRSSGSGSGSGGRCTVVLVGVIGEVHFVDIGFSAGGGRGRQGVLLLVVVVVVVLLMLVIGGIT